MTKRDIVVKIAKEMNFVQSDVATIVQATLDAIADELASGKSIELRNFGVFEINVRKGRVGRNPNQPEIDVPIPERAVVKFRAGRELKNAVEKLFEVWKENKKASMGGGCSPCIAGELVVGGGAAGLTAGIKAIQGGAKVILLEKTGMTGGASAMAGAGTKATGSNKKKKKDKEEKK